MPHTRSADELARELKEACRIGRAIFKGNHAPRPENEPEGETCHFCGQENDFWDDIGFFYISPTPEVNEKPTCKSCYTGEPGKKHVDRLGVGER